MSFVSPDAQLSVPFLVALAATPEAGSLTPEAARSAIEAGVGEAWEVLRLAVARSLRRRLEEGYLVDKETLWLLAEVRGRHRSNNAPFHASPDLSSYDSLLSQ